MTSDCCVNKQISIVVRGDASDAAETGRQRLRSVLEGERLYPRTPSICFLSKINSRQSTASSLQPEWRSGEETSRRNKSCVFLSGEGILNTSSTPKSFRAAVVGILRLFPVQQVDLGSKDARVISLDSVAGTAVTQGLSSNSGQMLRKPVKLRVNEIAKSKDGRMTPSLIWWNNCYHNELRRLTAGFCPAFFIQSLGVFCPWSIIIISYNGELILCARDLNIRFHWWINFCFSCKWV